MAKGVAVALLVLLLIAAGAVYFLLGGEFYLGNLQIKQIYRGNGVPEGLLSPGTLLQVNSLENDLKLFEAGLMQRAQTNDAKALLALVDFEKDLLRAERAMLNAKQHADDVGIYNPDCAAGGAAELAEKEFENAKRYSSSAATKAESFAQNYQTQAGIAEFDAAMFSAAMEALYEGADDAVADLKFRCGQ